jgi:chromosome partitioning protein
MSRVVVAMGGQKGGAGKSTVALSLAVAWQEAGVEVDLVDVDPQRTLGTWFTHRPEVETGGAMTLSCPVEDELIEVVKQLAARPGDGIVLVDLDGRNSVSQRAAMVCAHIFLVPVRAGVADVWALGDMLPLLEEALAYNPVLQARVVLNSMDRTHLAREVRGALRSVPIQVLDTELGYRVAYREAVAVGQGPTNYAPDDKAAREVRSLMRELTDISQSMARQVEP